jgi:hypothetical protein
MKLTTDYVEHVTAVPELLDRIDGPVAPVTPDGAYDADVVGDEIVGRHSESDVIIPIRPTSVISESGASRHDAYLRTIKRNGWIEWQRRSGYCQRSLVETAMFRYETITWTAASRPDSVQSRDGGENWPRSPERDGQARFVSNKCRTKKLGSYLELFIHQLVATVCQFRKVVVTSNWSS